MAHVAHGHGVLVAVRIVLTTETPVLVGIWQLLNECALSADATVTLVARGA